MNYSGKMITSFIGAADLIGATLDVFWNAEGGFNINIPVGYDHPIGRAAVQAYSACMNKAFNITPYTPTPRIWIKRDQRGAAVALVGPCCMMLDPGYGNGALVQLDNGQLRPDPSGEFQVAVQSLKNIKFFSRNLRNESGKTPAFCEIPFPPGLRWGTGIQISLLSADVETPESCAAVIRQLQVEIETRPVKLKEYLRQPEVAALVARSYEKEVAKKVARELRGK